MSIVKPSTALAEITLPPAPKLAHGGEWSALRTFNAAAVAPPVDAVEKTTAEPTQVDTTEPCPVFDGECTGAHSIDHVNGDVYHRTTAEGVSGPFGDDLLLHNLVQVNDERPWLEFCQAGDWNLLDLPAVDALIAATEKQLASLRDRRAHLAAALGEAPPSEPPENQKAQPADGATGTEAQA